MDNGESDAGVALQGLYVASYRRLVGLVGAVYGDQDMAEEAVQDAFVRLIGQWHKISRYEDPEAWLRRVALGYASNRRRKAVNGMRAAVRFGPPRNVPEPSGDSVDLTRALDALPASQREVLLLQHLGLDLAEIARHLSVAEGTVKSRLSRARAKILPLLREDVNGHV